MATSNHELVRRAVEDSGAIWENLRVDVDEIRGDGDSIVILGRIGGRGRGSEAYVEMPAALLIEVRDGLLARCETYRSLDDVPE